jgi:glycosyltransferase involved in cell wall biosynthesis
VRTITIQGPLEIAASLSKNLGIDLIPLKDLNHVPQGDVIIAGDSAHEKFSSASCKVILEPAPVALKTGLPVDLNTIVWKYHSLNENKALASWIKHWLKIQPLTLSVVIPVYNRQEHLNLCLKALTDQSIPSSEYEIIVIDDGSQDASAEVAKSYGTKTITTSNKGPAAARNIGIEEAKGDIIIFLDADILVANDYLEMVRERHSKSNSLLLLGARRHLPEGVNNPVEAAVNLDSREKLLRRYSFCLSHLNCPWSVAYTCNFSISRNFHDDIRFDEGYVGWGLEDIDFAYELYKQGAEIVFSKGICGYHLYHDRTLSPARYQSWLINLTRFLQKHPDPKAQGFDLFKGVFNPDIKDNYFDVFDHFENRPVPNKNLEVWDLTQINTDPVRWIQHRLSETASDVLLLADSSNATLEAYLPFLNRERIKSFIPKEDWKAVESEFTMRYEKENLCVK